MRLTGDAAFAFPRHNLFERLTACLIFHFFRSVIAFKVMPYFTMIFSTSSAAIIASAGVAPFSIVFASRGSRTFQISIIAPRHVLAMPESSPERSDQAPLLRCWRDQALHRVHHAS